MATPIISFGATVGGFVTEHSITGQDVGTGSNRIAVVAIGATNVNDDPVSVSIGTDSLTPQGTLYTDSSGWKFRLYVGELTVTGSQSVRAVWDDGFNVKLICGCVLPDSALPIGDLTTNSALTSSTQPTWTIDSATGDTVVALLFLDSAAEFTNTSPATLLTGTGLGGSNLVHGMYEAGASSVTIDGSVGGPTNVWRGFGFNVPASSGGMTEAIDSGVLNLSGQALGFKLSSELGSGLLTINGQDVTFTHNAVTNYSLSVEHGTLNFNGQGVDFTLLEAGNYSLTIDPGTITFSGADSNSGLAVTVDTGTITFSGQDVELTLENPSAYSLSVEPGNITFSGLAIVLRTPGSLGEGDKYVKLALLGYIGSINDMLLAYWKDNGAASSSFQDAQKEYLAAAGFTEGTLNDRWKAFYESLGYSGSLNDMENAYWWEL